jgi:hypothetical protein
MAYLSDISPYKNVTAGRITTGGGGLTSLERQIQQQKAALQSFSFDIKNPYAGMQNVFEDMTIDTRAAQLQQEALGQQQADILQGLQAGAGGAGAAALATGLARQAAKSQQQIAAGIGQQEQAIQMKKLSAEQQRQQQERAAQFDIDLRKQQMEYARMERMLGLSMEEAAAEELRRQQEEAEKAALGGAIGSTVLGAVGMAFGGPAGAALGSSLGGALGSAIA